MKNPYFLILSFFMLFVFFVSSIHAQAKIGVATGLNISNANFETDDGSLTHYYFGMQSQIPVKGKFSFNPSVIYSIKGWKFKSYSPAETGGEMNLHFIDIQLLGKYAISHRASLLGGVEIGRLIKTRRDPRLTLPVFDDFYEKNDLSLAVGIDYEIVRPVRLGIKYLHGVSYLTRYQLTDINGNSIGEGKDGNLRVIQLGISVDLITI